MLSLPDYPDQSKATDWEQEPATLHKMRIAGLSPGVNCRIAVISNNVKYAALDYVHLPDGPTPYPEISKRQLTATASSTYENDIWKYGPLLALNAVDAENGWVSNAGERSWLCIDLGKRHNVKQLGYMPPQGKVQGSIAEFRIYVMDRFSADEEAWGDPVCSGIWGTTPGRKDAFLRTGSCGRYLILYASKTAIDHAGAAEVWLYGSGERKDGPPK